MRSFTTLEGIVAPLEDLNVDTDQIIPKQFLKRIEKTGFGKFLFYDWRYLPDGKLNPDFEMNHPRYKEASILLAKENFGCGSSREHAPWALDDYGIKCLLAPSFADIFYNNCFNNGILPIVLDYPLIEELFKNVRQIEDFRLSIDLPNQRIKKPDGKTISFDIDSFRKHCLVNGLDPIGLTLEHEEKITEYEKEHGIL